MTRIIYQEGKENLTSRTRDNVPRVGEIVFLKEGAFQVLSLAWMDDLSELEPCVHILLERK